jgi:hypothetical protein
MSGLAVVKLEEDSDSNDMEEKKDENDGMSKIDKSSEGFY